MAETAKAGPSSSPGGGPGAEAVSRYWAGTDGTVRDRFWLFCCSANTDFSSVQRRSVMSPAEGAFYLDVPNVIMVQASTNEAQYGRFDPPLAQYALALRPLKRVAWSVVGSGGFTDRGETDEVLELAASTPNVTGIMFDDFFKRPGGDRRAVFSVEELARVRKRVERIDKPLDILATYYYRLFLDQDLDDYLEHIDVVTLWGGTADLPELDRTMERVEERLPGKRLMLGCYMFDFGNKAPVPVDLMQHQCETGLKWLRQGRIEGMILLSNTVADFDFPSVEWTRKWIGQVGEEELR